MAGSAQLVASWGADFDADQSAALAGLASMEGEAAAFFQVGACHFLLCRNASRERGGFVKAGGGGGGGGGACGRRKR